MPPSIIKLASTILYKPAKVTVSPVSSTVDIIKQFIYFVDKENKNNLLLEVLQDDKIQRALVLHELNMVQIKLQSFYRRTRFKRKQYMEINRKMHDNEH